MTVTHNRGRGGREQRVEPHDSLDDFPTPPWATRALLEALRGEGEMLERMRCWEPTCNRGYMARALAENFGNVCSTDIEDYGWEGQHHTRDFLLNYQDGWPCLPGGAWPLDWIIFNPPYRLAREFILRAIELAPRRGVAAFGRLGLLEGQERCRELWSRYRNCVVYPFAERVNLFKGVVRPTGGKPMAHAWYVWLRPFEAATRTPDIRVRHIAPCRKRLERKGDYDVQQT